MADSCRNNDKISLFVPPDQNSTRIETETRAADNDVRKWKFDYSLYPLHRERVKLRCESGCILIHHWYIFNPAWKFDLLSEVNFPVQRIL